MLYIPNSLKLIIKSRLKISINNNDNKVYKSLYLICYKTITCSKRVRCNCADDNINNVCNDGVIDCAVWHFF